MGEADGPTRRLRDLDEDGLLAQIVPRFAAAAGPTPLMLLGPGDDAAVLAAPGGSVVATTDTMVRDRDWRDDWSGPGDVGAKVVAQNLADVAAMGARPTGVLVTLVADPDTAVDWVLDFTDAVARACADAGVAVLGGDLSSAGAGTLMVSVTALGDLEGRDPVRRSGARPSDVVAVAGTLGLSDAGWRLLREGRPEADPEAVAVHRRPRPPLALGPAAALAGASAMLDVSDGLLRDGGRIGRASGVVLDLDSAALAPDLARLTPALGERDARRAVAEGGEEHSLLATFPPDATLPEGFRVIGTVCEEPPPAIQGRGSGVTVDGRPARGLGWDHFHL